MIPTPVIEAFFGPFSTLKCDPLGAGHINLTWHLFVDASPRSWVVQRLNTDIFRHPERVAHNFTELTRHLRASSVFSLEVPHYQSVIGSDQLHYVDESGQYWRACAYIEGTFAPERLPTAEHAHAAARAYGHFLHALHDMPPDSIEETLPGFHDTARRYETLEAAIRLDPMGRYADVRREVGELREARWWYDQVAKLCASGALPLRITHNDAKAGNVLLDSTTHQASAVIDWDTVMPGCLLTDYGDLVRSMASNQYEDDPDYAHLTIRSEVLAAITEGFVDGCADSITSTERTYLHLGAPWIISEQAVRFLSDYLSGDTYYKVQYPTHNLVRARNQLALLRLLT
jgi:aminoglycoside phosphotransferase (APT) family kinase protein